MADLMTQQVKSDQARSAASDGTKLAPSVIAGRRLRSVSINDILMVWYDL